MKIVDAALKYASNNIYVFPVREKDGKPYINSRGKSITPRAKSPYTPRGLLDATINKSDILSMWEDYPTAAVGINCGLSGLFAIDIDAYKGGALDNFMKMGISYQSAWQAITPGGGLHIIYSGNGRTTTNNKTNIDTRGDGGYIVAPPSWIINDNGMKVYYRGMGEWDGRPGTIPPDAFRLLGLEKDAENGVPEKYNNPNESEDELLKRVREWSKKLNPMLAYDYTAWVKVGMALYELGEPGFEIWSEWTERYFELKPESRRQGDLEKKWETFARNENVKIGTFFYYCKISGDY